MGDPIGPPDIYQLVVSVSQNWYANVHVNSSIASFEPQSRSIGAKSNGNKPTKLYFFN